MFTDALGKVHAPVAADAVPRIVSLVPSLTELLCDLGLQPYLVGRTGFCIHPRELVQSIVKVGGTKDVNIERIRELAPSHLVVNIDENEKPAVSRLAESIPNVIVTHPQAPLDNLALYQLFGDVFGALPDVAARASTLGAAFREAHAAVMQSGAGPAGHVEKSVLYCIWQDPWMTVSRDTYIARMLAMIGLRQWEPPAAEGGEASLPPARYPSFSWSGEVTGAIDAVLLSTEPYSFRQTHADQLERRIGKPVRLVDGEMLSWYGSRAIPGMRYLETLRHELGIG